jgi:hypothetical protein
MNPAEFKVQALAPELTYPSRKVAKKWQSTNFDLTVSLCNSLIMKIHPKGLEPLTF